MRNAKIVEAAVAQALVITFVGAFGTGVGAVLSTAQWMKITDKGKAPPPA